MLLTESEKAKWVRSRILDIVIATINEKTGGGTKYINRRDRNYVTSAIQEENYHRKMTDAIRDYVDGHKTFKYPIIIDMIYKAVRSLTSKASCILGRATGLFSMFCLLISDVVKSFAITFLFTLRIYTFLEK